MPRSLRVSCVSLCLLILPAAWCAAAAGKTTPVVALAAPDFTLDFKVTFEPGSEKAAASVTFCAVDEKNRYEFVLTTKHLSLARIEKGRRVMLLSGVHIKVRPAVPLDVGLTRRSGKVSIWVNDDLVASVRDTTFEAGAIAYGVTGDKVEVSDVRYAPLAAVEYESDPDELLIYASGQAMVTDHMQIPAGKRVRLVLPAGTVRESIEIVDGNVPVKACRIVEDPMAALASGSGRVGALAEGLKIEWDAPNAGPRDATVRYVMSGINWSPVYKLDILDGENASLALSFAIRNSARDIQEAQVSVVSGVSGGPLTTLASFGKMASRAAAAVRALRGESLAPDAYHVYALPGKHDIPKDGAATIEFLRKQLAFESRLEWDTTRHDQVAVVYRIVNDTEVPLPGGTVEVYRNGAPIGRDTIGWTPRGDDIELSIAGATVVRASVDSSVEQDESRGFKKEYRHKYVYELQAPKAVEVELIVAEPRDVADLTLTPQPTKIEDEKCRWLVKLQPQQTATVTVEYCSDSPIASGPSSR